MDAAGQRTRWRHEPGEDNPRGSCSHVEYADGSARQWRYDAEGLPVEVTDELGQRTRYAWGAFDLLEEVTDAAGAITRYHRDAAARLVGVTNAAGQRWTLERDAAGQVASQTDWHGRVTRYERNALGQLTHEHRADGSVLHHEYDEFDRLSAITAGEHRHTFDWDDSDRLVSARVWQRTAAGKWEEDSAVSLSYDEASRLVKESQHGQALEYGYDAAGRLATVRTPSGHTHWKYDAAGQPVSLASNAHRFDFSHDMRGLETQRRYRPQGEREPEELDALHPSGYVQYQMHDARSRLVSQAVCAQTLDGGERPETVGQQGVRSYRWDAAGHCTQMRETLHGYEREAIEWGYDARGQVEKVWHHTGAGTAHAQSRAEWYVYDALGNVSQQQQKGHIWPQEYEGDQVVKAGPDQYRYDACGRLTQRTEYKPGFRPRQWFYRWDGFGHLREVHNPRGERWSYRYDAFGRRISKECIQGKRHYRPQRVEYLWQGARLAEAWRTYEGGERQQHEIQRWHYRAGTYEALAQERLCYDKTSQLETESEWYPVASDPNGTPHTLYNSSGRALWRALSSLWGETERKDEQADREALARIVPDAFLASKLRKYDDGPECDLRFAGQWEDEESGLHYNLHRYYDPKTGQYLSTDPIGLNGGLRTHAYVHDPVQWIDPWGLAPCDSIRKVGELTPIHGPETLSKTTMAELSRLSDRELLRSVIDPKDGKPVQVNPETNRVFDGNSRVTELQRRALDPNSSITNDTAIPVREHIPDKSEFFDM